MSTLWIYGDSFADINYVPDKTYMDPQQTWPARLSQDISVVNRAVMGSGPDYAIQTLLDDLPNIHAEDSLLFVLSWPERLNLTDIHNDPQDQVELLNWAIGRIPQKDINKLQFAQMIFLHYMTDQQSRLESFKQLCAVDRLSKLFSKSIIWPASKELIRWPMETHSTVPQSGLVDISNGELANPVDFHQRSPDRRPNHLCEKNHINMYNILISWYYGYPLAQPQWAEYSA